MWVMITGITNVKNAKNAYDLGADALGLLVAQGQSEDCSFIPLGVAKSIAQDLSPRCECVLVTHLVEVQEIIRLVRITDMKTIQLPGNITPEDIGQIKSALPSIKVIKSLHVVDNYYMEYIERYIGIVNMIELDTIDIATSRIGGTGRTHDWSISRKIVREYGSKVRIILAGGLHSDNVENAIQTVEPFGIDVSTGVKGCDGIQDNKKLKSFIDKARRVECLAC